VASRFSALPAAAAPEATAAATEATAAATEATAAATEASAAAADEHFHGAGLSHDQQLIAESGAAAIILKVNNHLLLRERRHRFCLTNGAG
jgi:hypothetical protein